MRLWWRHPQIGFLLQLLLLLPLLRRGSLIQLLQPILQAGVSLVLLQLCDDIDQEGKGRSAVADSRACSSLRAGTELELDLTCKVYCAFVCMKEDGRRGPLVLVVMGRGVECLLVDINASCKYIHSLIGQALARRDSHSRDKSASALSGQSLHLP